VTGAALIPFGRLLSSRCSRARGLFTRVPFPQPPLVAGRLTPRKDHCPPPDPPTRSTSLQGINPHAAAVASGAAEQWVAVPPDRDAHPVRRFGTGTVALEAMADGLLDCDVTTVAMASTGVSGMPLCEVVEARGFQAVRIDPRQAPRAPGRPTSAPSDCQGLQRLHTYGLLAAAFRPADQVGGRRSSLRHRPRLITAASQPIQPRQKALEQRNLTRPAVGSAITGVTGMAIITALFAGARDPAPLARLRDRRGTQDAAQIAKALPGPWRAEHLFALRHAVALSAFSHRHLATCDGQMAAHVATFPAQRAGQPLPPKPRQSTRQATAPRCEARTPLSRMAGVDLTALEGIEEDTALVILSAIGTDRHRWPSVKHLCRGLGLSPCHKVSGGKGLSRRVRPGAHRVAVALRLAAGRVHHSQRA
jgi:transposase